MEEEVKPKRKTVKQVDAEQDLVEQAVVDLANMVRFLNANRNYWAEDYLSERPDSALAQLLGKSAQ